MRGSSRRQLIEQLLQPWKESGLSISKFCSLNNIPVNTFRFWLKKFQQEENSKNLQQGFIPIHINDKPGNLADEKRIEIIYPNGIKITLPSGKSTSFIRSLIQ
jgi:hypothetical protein